jgi:tetratricopeptide (TPR) repeat protein
VPDWYYQNLGLAYFAKGDCQQAVREGAKAAWVAVDRNTAMATCYVELGQVDDARAELTKLLEEQPDLTSSNLDQYLPYKRETVLKRMRTALTQVGLSE